MSATLQSPSSCVDLERPVFVCGVGRSGTSLLQSMLNAHPDLCFPPETHFFRRHVMDASGAWDELAKERLVARLQDDEDFARAGLDARALLAEERSAQGPAGVFRALLEGVARRAGKTRIGDKDPKNIDALPALAQEFPAGYVLHVIRDPRDVLVSRMKAAWSAHRPWYVHPLIYAEQLRRGREEGARLFGERYLELHYEELIAAPEATLQRVCDHVGMPFDPCMLQFGASAAQLVDPKEMSWKKETLGPLLAGNSGKWRKALTARQASYTEAVCAEAFDSLGYERSVHTRWGMASIAPALRLAMTWAYDRRLGA